MREAMLPTGKTPTIKLPARQGHLSLIASITNRGDLRFMMYRGALNADLFILFAERLIKDSGKKVYLSVHKAKKVQTWQQTYRDKIKLFSPTSVCTTT